MLKGFKDFILRGNVVDLAVAVVIGAAFGAVVNSFVKNIITPIIAAIGGQPDFSKLKFTINKSTFFYGAFINAVIPFVIIAVVIYFVVVMPLNKIAERRALKTAKGEPDPTPKAEDIQLLEQIRDLLADGGATRLEKSAPKP